MRRRRRRRKRRKKGRRRRRKKTIPKPYTSYYVRKKPTRCDKMLNFIHSTCFGHHYVHHQEYKPGSCLCCEVLAVVCVYCSEEVAVGPHLPSSTHIQQPALQNTGSFQVCTP